MQDLLQPLQAAELAEIEQDCVKRYKETKRSDERACLKLIKHALQLSSLPGVSPVVWVNDPARDLLIDCYMSLIEATMNSLAVRSREARDEVIQEVWVRFWGRASKGKFTFDSLGQFITYLKVVTVSCVVDRVKKEIERNQEVAISALTDSGNSDDGEDGSPIEPFTQPPNDPEYNPDPASIRKRFEARCNELLHNDNPAKIRIFSLYRFGYPARDIAKQLINEGQRINDQQPTSDLVSTMLEQIFKRLQKDEEIRDLLQSD